MNDTRMILEFSGWVECDPDKTTFQYIGGAALRNDPGFKEIITGAEYLDLTEDERDCYILEDLGQAYTNSLDGELSDLVLEVENEQVR
tara:strand:- start:232 stop:495 length:264 start_codon:yes stop_codon:yes gene_type:complete